MKKLSEGHEVRKKVDSCLQNVKAKYAERKDDIEFQQAVSAKVNEQCPDANTALQAMFTMLFNNDK